VKVLAIDPGSTESAYTVVDRHYQPLTFGKIDNHQLLITLPRLAYDADVAIEQIGHYGTGMPAGRTVFDTCIWIGRFMQRIDPIAVTLTLRATVKTHLCGSPRATDANVTQALVDRFAPGAANHGKGTKAQPGYFHGFRADAWQSFALAVYHLDRLATPLTVTGS